MPKGIYSRLSCRSNKDPFFKPTKHQEQAVQAFLKSKFKGMLLYHKLGSGKTCTSILIADKMLRRKKIKKVFIMSPGSLRSGWITEYCNICGYKSKYLNKYYSFVTYNYMVGRNLPNFNNSLVIIDEVHNLINGVKNRSFHPSAIYEALRESNCRILALSGTPIYNYVYEFALLGNLLKPGGEFPEIRHGKEEVDEIAFLELFDEQADGSIKPRNMTTMKRRLDGIISYYPGAGEEYVPRVDFMKPIKVRMSMEQENNYWNQVIQENKLKLPPSKKLLITDPRKYERLKKLFIMAQKNILSRRASNFLYPNRFVGRYEDEDEEDDSIKNLNKFPPDLTCSEGGWVRKKYFKHGELYKIYSPKFTALLINIVMHNKQKHVVFTFFKKRAGVMLIKSILKMCGIKSEIFSGDLNDQKRKRILARFNDKKNRHGDDIRVLLVTEAGAEGISILEARHMHILESSPRMSKTIQAIGRIARFKSHTKLPKDEQNVKVWRYWSVANPEPETVNATYENSNGDVKKVSEVISNKKTIDEILYEKGIKTINRIDSFLDLLKRVSVTPY